MMNSCSRSGIYGQPPSASMFGRGHWLQKTLLHNSSGFLNCDAVLVTARASGVWGLAEAPWSTLVTMDRCGDTDGSLPRAVTHDSNWSVQAGLRQERWSLTLGDREALPAAALAPPSPRPQPTTPLLSIDSSTKAYAIKPLSIAFCGHFPPTAIV